MTVVVVVVVVVVALATYVTWTAQRLDRLHARVDRSAAALDTNLVRRAAAAAAFAHDSGRLPADLAAALAAAARDAGSVEGLGHDREVVENSLSRALHTALATAPAAFTAADAEVDDLRAATTKVTYARRFHNDAVRDTLSLRGQRVPRLLRLAGSAPKPAYFEIDDTALPAAPPTTAPGGR